MAHVRNQKPSLAGILCAAAFLVAADLASRLAHLDSFVGMQVDMAVRQASERLPIPDEPAVRQPQPRLQVTKLP